MGPFLFSLSLAKSPGVTFATGEMKCLHSNRDFSIEIDKPKGGGNVAKKSSS